MKDLEALNLQVLETKIDHAVGNPEIVHVQITIQARPEILERCIIGLLFVLGRLSFNDARPRGRSSLAFTPNDEWTVEDTTQRLSSGPHGLHFEADYVRGRCVKTTIDADRNGTIILKTRDRGEAATRWIIELQGKRTIFAV